MIDACVHMMARNSEDYIQASLESVLPYVKRVLVGLDSRSSDRTRGILDEMKGKWPNLQVIVFPVKDPFHDLVSLRNFMLKQTTEKFGWIVDSDEVYPQRVMVTLDRVLRKLWGVMAFGFSSWAVWDKNQAHMVTSGRHSMRVFRNSRNLMWQGSFGIERLVLGDWNLCHEFLPLKAKYVHFTHLKADTWRKELHHERRIDVNNMALIPLPDDIKSLVGKIYVEKKDMPNV